MDHNTVTTRNASAISFLTQIAQALDQKGAGVLAISVVPDADEPNMLDVSIVCFGDDDMVSLRRQAGILAQAYQQVCTEINFLENK